MNYEGAERVERKHPDIYEFVIFNILSNCATITNFAVMWVCTEVGFRRFREIPFQVFVFDSQQRKEAGCFVDFKL